ncbi:hypothetical protein ACLRDC_01720 [Gluconacetobacter sacchari]|uniref:Uncharacterized protein n=2 Tax=Gluconacetobacter sacchari TaxID=92759 RepID=A0A7W4IBG5_9PROT|nr:hypothetical protein [Gluconacetobacter sacchari]MBB2159798.1 hypothetical protein [Gluconacetobacter sacchari]GBQ21772.1 hypothetical protein AA12717_0993 [Gluconacetobacter sacchari DSM 12717]
MTTPDPSPAGKRVFLAILLVMTLGLGVYTLHSAFTALHSTVQGAPPAPADSAGR